MLTSKNGGAGAVGTAHRGCPPSPQNKRYDLLFRLLTAYPSGRTTFNQYRDVHPELDRADGAQLRCANLNAYLNAFSGARHILIGEAAGYAGCRFSGIPFTSEAQIVSTPRSPGWLAGLDVNRSSAAERPWAERSATVVWASLDGRRDCLLWNAFPWHPFLPDSSLTNRPPGKELEAGLDLLGCLLELFPQAQPYAVGRVAQRALTLLGVDAPYIRHPSYGGARQFAHAVAAL